MQTKKDTKFENRYTRNEVNEEEDVKEEELINVIKRLKKEKALGEDGVGNEAWLFTGETFKKN